MLPTGQTFEQRTGLHFLATTDLPFSFWQATDEDQSTVTSLEALQDSMQEYGLCWMVWDVEQQSFYEARDLYRCSIIAVDAYDILDRAIPSSDLYRRDSIQVFFSAQEFHQLLSTQPVLQGELSRKEKARPFLTGVDGDEPGLEPVGSIEVAVPFASFQKVVNKARYGAARHGKQVVMLHSHLLYLKAVLLTLDQCIERETDLLRRQTFVHQRERIQQMRDLRSEWMYQHKQYVAIQSQHQGMYIVRVGMHPLIYQGAA